MKKGPAFLAKAGPQGSSITGDLWRGVGGCLRQPAGCLRSL